MNVIETQRLCIRETAADNVTGEGLGRCILLLKSDGEMIGRCWLSWRNHQGRRRLEVSCLLRREHRRKGYATEAVQGCLRFAFETLGVAEVFATIPGAMSLSRSRSTVVLFLRPIEPAYSAESARAAASAAAVPALFFSTHPAMFR